MARKRSKKSKRRYVHGSAHGPGKPRRKRRKSSKKRRKLRFTIRYDKRGQVRRRRRPGVGHRARAVRSPRRPLGIAVSAPASTPGIAAITAAITSRAHRPIVPRAPIVPHVLAPKVPFAAPTARTIFPKAPADLAARTVKAANQRNT